MEYIKIVFTGRLYGYCVSSEKMDSLPFWGGGVSFQCLSTPLTKAWGLLGWHSKYQELFFSIRSKGKEGTLRVEKATTNNHLVFNCHGMNHLWLSCEIIQAKRLWCKVDRKRSIFLAFNTNKNTLSAAYTHAHTLSFCFSLIRHKRAVLSSDTVSSKDCLALISIATIHLEWALINTWTSLLFMSKIRTAPEA